MPKTKKQPDHLDEETLALLLQGFNDDELVELVANYEEIRDATQKLGPQSKEELWHYFKEKYKVELSTVAVCEGHTSQLDLVWEVYSFKVKNVLWVLSRGSGKTFLMALVDYTQCEFYPGFGSFTIGPGKNQGERKYTHILPYVIEGGVIGGKEMEHVARSVLTKTELKNTSHMEISLGGEPANAAGPREPRLHRDERELMNPATYKKAGNIPAGRMSRDGRYMPAQIIDTTTMEMAGGPVDLAIEAFNDAIQAGMRPRQEVRIACIFEAAAENPTCRSMPDDVRRARLIELERDPDELCECNTYQSGDMPNEDPDVEPEPRTLDKVCQGRFFRSRGHKHFDDITTLFQENDPDTWDSEQECSQPAREGAYLKAYNQIRSGIKGYEPNPDYGDIYSGTDWGGSDEHSHGWYQWLQVSIEITMWKSGLRRVIPAGSVVRFAEIYKAQIGDVALGQRVQEMESEWMLKWPGWRVKERYVDVANLSARLNWRDQLGMTTISRVKKDFNAEVNMVRALVGSRYWFIDVPACPWGDKALRAWKQVNGHEVHDWACLVAGTLVRTDAGNVPIEYVCAGERVWTREGLKPVLWAGYTKTAETVVVDVESGKSLECTPDHRFWTDRGWVQAQDLMSNDMLLSWRSFERSECGSMSSTEDGASTDSQMRPDSLIVPTSRAVKSTFIEPSGRTSGEKSLMGARFTTETETSTTTSSATSLLRASADTVAYMVRYLRALADSRTSIESGPWHTQQWLEMMYVPACASATSIFGPGASRVPSSASTVTSPSSRPRCDRPSSARRLIDRLLGRLRGSTTSSASARDAGRPSRSTSTSSSSSVPARVLGVRQSGRSVAVYDVCVDECHEFFADGVLVHNSHPMAELRYFESNRQVHVREAARENKIVHSSNRPRAADEDRSEERQQELGNRVVVTYNKPREKAELMGVGAAADSPLMDERRSDRVLGGMPARERSRRGY